MKLSRMLEESGCSVVVRFFFFFLTSGLSVFCPSSSLGGALAAFMLEGT